MTESRKTQGEISTDTSERSSPCVFALHVKSESVVIYLTNALFPAQQRASASIHLKFPLNIYVIYNFYNCSVFCLELKPRKFCGFGLQNMPLLMFT